VYGGDPEFDQVFAPARQEQLWAAIGFYARFDALTDVRYDRAAEVYVYQPYDL